MGRKEKQLRKDLAALVGQRPGWRLEPRTTPGTAPLWCYVEGGRVELSVTAEGEGIHLSVMATDDEIVLGDAEALAAWLRAHRRDAFGDPRQKPTGRDRHRKFFEWS